jgi:hypothetical protein
MAFSELELKLIEQALAEFCRKRSPAHLRDKLRLEYSVKGHEVVIVERRPKGIIRRSGSNLQWPSSNLSGRPTSGDSIGSGQI